MRAQPANVIMAAMGAVKVNDYGYTKRIKEELVFDSECAANDSECAANSNPLHWYPTPLHLPLFVLLSDHVAATQPCTFIRVPVTLGT